MFQYPAEYQRCYNSESIETKEIRASHVGNEVVQYDVHIMSPRKILSTDINVSIGQMI
jgi:hypothetical protein